MLQTQGGRPWALVLAGGDGTRLRRLTRVIDGRPIPKQYCTIVGDRSLFERTLARARRLVPAARTLVVVSRDHLRVAHEQLRDILPLNLVVQPCNRETGPGVLLPLALLERRDPDATVAIFPSDHWIGSERRFVGHVARAASIVAASPERVAVLGVRPTGADPDYGYLVPGRPLDVAAGPATAVRAFFEKPARPLAARLVRGGALWSTFVLVARVETLLAAAERLVPEAVAVMRRLARRPEERAAAYPTLAPWSFSQGVLRAMADALVVGPVDDVEWSDWGTPEAILRTLSDRAEKPPWWAEAQALVA